jgi:hypothetical protein
MTFRFAVLVLGLTVCVPAARAQSTFPMEKGTTWIYGGRIRWTVEGSTVSEKAIQWKSTVVRHAMRGNAEAALIHGWPSDLAWYEEGTEPGDYVVLRNGKSYYLFVNDAEKTFHEFITSSNFKPDPDRIFFRTPLKIGTKFCGPDDESRPDTNYCWYVPAMTRRKVRAAGVEDSLYPVATLQFYTMPDHERMELAERIGIVRFEYHHHGTVSDVKLVLLKYVPGKDE